MTTRTHRCLTHVRAACRSAQKHTMSTALLSLLLLTQPVLVEAQVQAKFVEVPRLENPLTPLIDVERNAKPTFADIDNDGDFDVFIGNSNGTVKYYENTGTVNHPIFEERTGENNPFNYVDVEDDSSPTLVDIDNDKDLDAFIGGERGGIRYYENTGTVSKATFVKRIEEKNPLNSVNERDSIPVFVDIDSDGDLDAFIGTDDGIVKYYKNTGSVSQPIFEERTEQENPFNGIDVGYDTVPFLVDIDSDGDFDAFIGFSSGTVKYYENMGTAKLANFIERTEQDNPLNDANVGSVSAPALIDIDGDSDLDAFIGARDGTIKYYENIGNSKEPNFVERTNLDNPFGGLVDNDISLTLADIDNDGDLDAFATQYNEAVKYYENININQPSFVERIEQDNPLNGVNSYYFLAFIDIDADGDLDAFLAGRMFPSKLTKLL